MANKSNKGMHFSQIESAYIKENFGKIPNEEIAKNLHRTIGAVIQKAHRLGVCGTYKKNKSNEQ